MVYGGGLNSTINPMIERRHSTKHFQQKVPKSKKIFVRAVVQNAVLVRNNVQIVFFLNYQQRSKVVQLLFSDLTFETKSNQEIPNFQTQ